MTDATLEAPAPAQPLDALPAQSRAVLSLILGQSRSFDQIAELLRINRDEVRARAHTAADQLAPDRWPAADARSRIVDYLLGEQSASERARTRSELASSAAERAWGAALAQALAPLAKDSLPAIPPPSAKPTQAAKTPPSGETPPKACTQLRLPGWRLIATVLAATGAVVATLLVITQQPAHKATRTHSAKRAPQPGGAQTLHRLVLQPAGSQKTAFGAGAIVRQNGSLLLLLQGRGLTPNHRDSYAVWLSNTPTDSRLLGFVSPLVGPDGTFSSGVSLPDDAVRFENLVITRETAPRPTAPSRAILRSPLSLS